MKPSSLSKIIGSKDEKIQASLSQKNNKNFFRYKNFFISKSKRQYINLKDEQHNNEITNRYFYKEPSFLSSLNIQNQINLINENKILKDKKYIAKTTGISEISLPLIMNYGKSNSLLKYRSLMTLNLNKKEEEGNKNVNYYYKNVFKDKKNIYKTRLIDNRLNLIYAENENQYKYLFEKMFKEQDNGIKKTIFEDSEKINKKLNDIQTKVKFIKDIMDYSFPGFILTKVQTVEKNLWQKKNNSKFTLPVQNRENKNREKNRFRTHYLSESININKKINAFDNRLTE